LGQKTRGQKSHDTDPLKATIIRIYTLWGSAYLISKRLISCVKVTLVYSVHAVQSQKF